MIKSRYLFTSESVCEGHPDKICDQISDGILDACLEADPESRVAIETLTKTGVVIVAGELTTQAYVNIPQIARQTLKEIGYTRSSYGIEYETCAVLVHIEEQSPDIAIGVDREGAGDQGMMFGYATAETANFMPLPIDIAHKLTMKMAEVRKNGTLHYLGPDGKAQVTVEYENGKPLHIKAVVASNQHDENISHKQIEDDFLNLIIKPVCGDLLSPDCKFYINPTGSFVRGGPYADAGLTGRKIIVDTYGGMGRHGGGCFSGKDPSKVDRSGAYAARYIAKNIVAAGIAEKCEVQVAYAIGVADPVSLNVNFFGTGKLSEERVEKMIREIFPLRPKEIIKTLNLKRPIYKKTASYGHFGREEFPWEKLDKVEVIKKYAGI